MRTPPALLASILLALCLTACGGAGKDTPSNSTHSSTLSTGSAASTTSIAKVKLDNDNDSDNPTNSYYDSDDGATLDYGRAASPAEKLEVEALVKRYYTVAVAADGSTGCSLVSAATAESVVELYGDDSADPALHGNTCAVVVSKLFTQRHQQFAAELSTLRVTSVRVGPNGGWALLSSGNPQSPGRMFIHREGAAWKIDQLVESNIP